MMLAEVTCGNPNCKKEFTANVGNRKFCSDSCRGEAYAMKKHPGGYMWFHGKRMTIGQIAEKSGIPVLGIKSRMKWHGASIEQAANPEFQIRCKWCNEEFNPGYYNRNGYCGIACSNKADVDREFLGMRSCPVCEELFHPKSRQQKYCSPKCKGKVKYLTGVASTEEQYKKISGDWEKYFLRLCTKKRRGDGLTPKLLMDLLHAQEYRCALSGEEMTCRLEKGKKFPTNASIDRIDAGGEYSRENIRLVCKAVNQWRGDLDTNEYIRFCHKVAQLNPIEDKVL